jgi:hypothetical protein
MYHLNAKQGYNVLMPSSGKERKINLRIALVLLLLLLTISLYGAPHPCPTQQVNKLLPIMLIKQFKRAPMKRKSAAASTVILIIALLLLLPLQLLLLLLVAPMYSQ